MSTTHRVKMAKASQADIDAAIELYHFLEAMREGGRAADAVDEFGYPNYRDLVALDAADIDFLLRAHERGGLFRVVWGLQVLLDPVNEVVDPNLPHLELHPKHTQAEQERAAAREGRRLFEAAARELGLTCGGCPGCSTYDCAPEAVLRAVVVQRDNAHAALQGIATVLAAAVGAEACPPVTAGNLHAVVDECLARVHYLKADGAMLIRQIDRQQARIAAMREEQRLVDKLTTDVAAVRSRAREAWFDLLARHERQKAKASGTGSSHSAASEARSEERSADANHRTDRDPEGDQLEQQRRAPGGADQGVQPGLREHDGPAGRRDALPADQREAVREQGAGGAVPAGAESADGGGLLAATGVAADSAPRRCAKCGLAENDHDVRHVFVPAGGRR